MHPMLIEYKQVSIGKAAVLKMSDKKAKVPQKCSFAHSTL
jgi:hypothetical protein